MDAIDRPATGPMTCWLALAGAGAQVTGILRAARARRETARLERCFALPAHVRRGTPAAGP